jgi:recombination protein RecA
VTRKAETDALIAEVNKEFKSDVLKYASQIPIFQRVTTGSLAFDLALGGGFPMNTWNEIIGLESHGKTVLALKTIAAAQANDPTHMTLWIASEDFNKPWAQSLGCDTDRIILAETNIMEDAYAIMIKALDKQTVDAIVLDSYPALVATAEEDSTFMDVTVAVGARLTNKLMRVSPPAMRRKEEERPCLCLIINQWRDRIVQMGDPRTTPGGKGKNFSFFTRIDVVRDGWIEAPSKAKVGQVIKIKTLKNKTAPPFRTAQTNFYFDGFSPFSAGDYDIANEINNIALTYEIIERRGAWYHYGDEKWNGKEAVMQALREDLGLQRQVDIEVRRRVLGIEPPKVSKLRRTKRPA